MHFYFGYKKKIAFREKNEDEKTFELVGEKLEERLKRRSSESHEEKIAKEELKNNVLKCKAGFDRILFK